MQTTSRWQQIVLTLILWGTSALAAPLAQANAASTTLAKADATYAVMLLPKVTKGTRPAPLKAYAAGQNIWIRSSHLPRPAGPLCVGLASLIDQYSLPLNLGRLRATTQGAAELHTRIPAGLIGPEPPGPYLLFVGNCATPAPTGDYARTVISIHA